MAKSSESPFTEKISISLLLDVHSALDRLYQAQQAVHEVLGSIALFRPEVRSTLVDKLQNSCLRMDKNMEVSLNDLRELRVTVLAELGRRQ